MHIPHELTEEFPADAAFIDRLAASNYEFRRLAISYDEVNRQIFKIESQEKPTSDEVLERLKKRWLLLKDDIAAILSKLKLRM